MINEILSSVPPNGYFSPEALSDATNISKTTISEILVKLSDNRSIDIEFIINCSNSNFSSVHTSTHNSFKNLVEYVESNNYSCIECGEEISEKDVTVFFKMPSSNLRRLP